MENQTIRLYTTFYFEKDELRRSEYLEALQRNERNDFIDEINILIEEGAEIPLQSDKIKYEWIKNRPTFQVFINLCNSKEDGKSVHIISNTDIYFNDTISHLKNLGKNEIFSLNRWDVLNTNTLSIFTKYSTADAWIFKGKIDFQEANYYLGQLGCDNRFLYDMKKLGYSLSNPAFSILSFHLHSSMVRSELSKVNSDNRVDPPYVYVFPSYSFKRNGTNKFRITTKIKLFLLQRNMKFQYYYDVKNKLIQHEHEIVGAKTYSKLRYWLNHDFKLPIYKLNRFDRKEFDG